MPNDRPIMKNVREKMASQRTTILKTIAVYLMFIILGMSAAVPGPTLINMKQLFATDTATISLGMSLNGVGYMISAALCGFLFDRFNREVQFCIGCLVGGTAFLLAPWTVHVYALIALMAVYGLGLGYVDTGGNAQIISMWKDHKVKDPLLQGLHFAWSIGSTLAPFLITPFLTSLQTTHCTQNLTIIDLQAQNDNNETNATWTESSGHNFTNCSMQMVNVHVSRVRYAYLFIGGLMICVSLLYFCMYFSFKTIKSADHIQKKVYDQNNVEESSCYRNVFFLLLFIFAFSFAISVNVAGGYYSLFVVEHLKWTVVDGAILTSVFMAGLGVGRFLGIFISCIFQAKNLLFINISLTFTAHLLMLLVNHIGDYGMYAAVGIAGLGLSTMIVNMLLWLSSILTATSKLSSVNFTGISSGFIIGYALVGKLMQSLGSVWLLYALMATSVTQMTTFGLMLILKRIGHRKNTLVIDEIEVDVKMIDK